MVNTYIDQEIVSQTVNSTDWIDEPAATSAKSSTIDESAAR